MVAMSFSKKEASSKGSGPDVASKHEEENVLETDGGRKRCFTEKGYLYQLDQNKSSAQVIHSEFQDIVDDIKLFMKSGDELGGIERTIQQVEREWSSFIVNQVPGISRPEYM